MAINNILLRHQAFKRSSGIYQVYIFEGMNQNKKIVSSMSIIWNRGIILAYETE